MLLWFMLCFTITARIEMLTFLFQLSEKTKDGHIQWRCRCDCGSISIYMATKVRTKRIIYCNQCSLVELAKKNSTHGMKNTSTYSTWSSMKDRCLNEKSKSFLFYGGKGITVCKEWANSFEQFYKDMGEKPKGTSIDRINNELGYFKENCRWATHSEQQRNKQNSCKWLVCGVLYETLLEASIVHGVKKQTIVKWVDGWFDKRRNKQWSPKNGCKRIFKY